jgi:hypothetical protein
MTVNFIRKSVLAGICAAALTLVLGACSTSSKEAQGDPYRDTQTASEGAERSEGRSLIGGLFGGGSDRAETTTSVSPSYALGEGIGVNTFLWRASLDTLAFMPLLSADPFGGVIITDWYVNPNASNERFKITVYILDRRLRADGIRVNLFRQERAGNGNWVDASVNPQTRLQIENAILTRARQLRLGSVEG